MGFLAHIAYYTLLPSFPFISFKDVRFLASAVLFVVSTALWTRYFWDVGASSLHIVSWVTCMAVLVPGGLAVSCAVQDTSAGGGEADKVTNAHCPLLPLHSLQYGNCCPWAVS